MVNNACRVAISSGSTAAGPAGESAPICDARRQREQPKRIEAAWMDFSIPTGAIGADMDGFLHSNEDGSDRRQVRQSVHNAALIVSVIPMAGLEEDEQYVAVPLAKYSGGSNSILPRRR